MAKIIADYQADTFRYTVEFKDKDGEWHELPTGFHLEESAKAEAMRQAGQGYRARVMDNFE